MKNIDKIHRIEGMLKFLLEHVSRNNPDKPKYWYPLSMATYGTEEIVQCLDSLCSFRTTMWEKVKHFEAEFTNWITQGHVINYSSTMVNSGSSADLLMCMELMNPATNGTCKPGDEILIPVVTWPTQVWSAIVAGFKPVFVDVDPNTLNIDYEDMERKITNKTKSVFIVHLMGNPCNMDIIEHIRHNKDLYLIEDCCEAQGAKFGQSYVGMFGEMSAYSFFFSHHMTTMEGGMVLAKGRIGEILKTLRSHGWQRGVEANAKGFNVDPRYMFINLGFNLRPTELQAGFGIEQLKKLNSFNHKRAKLADYFYNGLKSNKWLKGPEVEKHGTPCWFALPIGVKDSAPFNKKELTDFLEKEGVETRPIVAGNLMNQPVRELYPDIFTGEYPGAEIVHNQWFYVGLSPMMNLEHIKKLLMLLEVFSLSASNKIKMGKV